MKLKNRAVDWIKDCSQPSSEMVVDRYALGALMRGFRQERNVSLKHVADQIGFTAPYLSDCERGFRQLSEEKLQAFIDACEEAP